MILAKTPLPDSDQHAIGDYAGSTCIPIAPRWFVTADHVGYSNTIFLGRNRDAYNVVERIKHPFSELTLLRVDRNVPRWYPPRRTPGGAEDDCIMLGYGQTAAVGEPWGFPRQPLAGTNKLNSVGNWAASNFSEDGGPHEAQFAMNDSGGGWVEAYTIDANGDGYVTVDDIYSFLDTWFGARGTIQQFFNFLNAWFKGRKAI